MQPDRRISGRLQLGMAPLVDVMLLLLIFFVLTSTQMAPRHLEVALPDSASARRDDVATIVVVVVSDALVEVDGVEYPLDRLDSAIAARVTNDGEEPISIEADAATPLQTMIRVIDEIKAGGGRGVRLATAIPG